MPEPVALELLLHDPQVRRDRARVAALLDPEFEEVGASGRVWTRSALLDLLAREPGRPISATQVRANPLTTDLVLVSYTSESAGRRARRTSLWRRTDGRWQLLHHQGTPVP